MLIVKSNNKLITNTPVLQKSQFSSQKTTKYLDNYLTKTSGNKKIKKKLSVAGLRAAKIPCSINQNRNPLNKYIAVATTINTTINELISLKAADLNTIYYKRWWGKSTNLIFALGAREVKL